MNKQNHNQNMLWTERGKMARPAKKRAYWEAKKKRAGELQAEVEAQRRKPLDVSAKEHIGKILDNLKIDPIETLAILGMTITVYNIITGTERLMNWVTNLPNPMPSQFPQAASAAASQVLGTQTNKFIIPNDWNVWLISLSLAYIIVRHAGQLIGLLEKGLSTVIPFLLGMP